MQHILPRLQEGGEILNVFVLVHLGGHGGRAVPHGLVKIAEGNALAQVVPVLHAVHGKMKADIVQIPFFEMLLRNIGRGAAAEDVGVHGVSSFKYIYRAGCCGAAGAAGEGASFFRQRPA